MAFNMVNLLTFLLTFIPMMLAASIPGLSIKAIRAGDSDYTLSDLVFKGTIHGVEVELNGTAESIYSQFGVLHPIVVARYNAEHGSLLNGAGPVQTRSLEARNKAPPPTCYPPEPAPQEPANCGRIGEGINYLRGLSGGCCVGGRSCVRISCSWNSAIFLCNDNEYGICPSCIYLASYAEDIQNDCSYLGEWDKLCGGQLFDTDHYNIIVRNDRC